MIRHLVRRCCLFSRLLLSLLAASIPAYAQFEGPVLGAGPWLFETYEQDYLKASILARGLDHPFGLAFIPGTTSAANPLGDVLITERTGKVKLFRNGQLQPEPVADFKTVFSMEQLFDIKLHPQFADNHLIYFTYIKTAPNPNGTKDYWVTTALANGRYENGKLHDVKDVFVAQAWSSNIGGASSRLHFLADGTLLFGVSHRLDEQAPQKLDSHIGKILRLNDDGTAPKDNPYFAVEGALPEIFTWGNRSVMDFATNPQTGDVLELENGPQGGDEVNLIKPSNNYGWPVATFGRDYDGTRFSPQPWVEGTALPELFFVPSITVAGLTFYTGDKFPKWKNNLFVTSMIEGRIPGTGHLVRVVFNENGEVRRESILRELKQRIRQVKQGPDDLLYLLTDHTDGVLMRLEPGTAADMVGASAMASSNAIVPPDEEAGLNMTPLFMQHDCIACHRMGINFVGPAYRSIAAKYPLNDTTIDLVALKIINGGAGVWGDTPMAPHSNMSIKMAQELATKILELGK